MSRSVFLGIAGALVALLVLWFGRDGDAPPQSDLDSPSVPFRELAPEPPLETAVRQQASESPVGSPQPAILRTKPNIFTVIDGRDFPEVESSPWSDDMERTILSYVSQQSLALTDLQVQCEDATGCVIFMGGSDVPIDKLKFGLFAEEQGFEFVVIRKRDNTDGRIVMLRR